MSQPNHHIKFTSQNGIPSYLREHCNTTPVSHTNVRIERVTIDDSIIMVSKPSSMTFQCTVRVDEFEGLTFLETVWNSIGEVEIRTKSANDHDLKQKKWDVESLVCQHTSLAPHLYVMYFEDTSFEYLVTSVGLANYLMNAPLIQIPPRPLLPADTESI